MKIQKVFNGKEILTNGDTCNNTSLCLPYTKDNKQSNKKEEKCQNNKKTKIPGGALTSVIANRAKVLVDVIDLVPGHAAGPDHAPGT